MTGEPVVILEQFHISPVQSAIGWPARSTAVTIFATIPAVASSFSITRSATPARMKQSAALAFIVTRPGMTLFKNGMSNSHPTRTEAPARMPVVLAPRDELRNRETSRLLEGIVIEGWFICGRDHLRVRLVLFCILGSDLNDPFDSRHQIAKHIVFLNKIVSAGLKCQFAIIRFVLQCEKDDTHFGK